MRRTLLATIAAATVILSLTACAPAKPVWSETKVTDTFLSDTFKERLASSGVVPTGGDNGDSGKKLTAGDVFGNFTSTADPKSCRAMLDYALLNDDADSADPYLKSTPFKDSSQSDSYQTVEVRARILADKDTAKKFFTDLIAFEKTCSDVTFTDEDDSDSRNIKTTVTSETDGVKFSDRNNFTSATADPFTTKSTAFLNDNAVFVVDEFGNKDSADDNGYKVTVAAVQNVLTDASK